MACCLTRVRLLGPWAADLLCSHPQTSAGIAWQAAVGRLDPRTWQTMGHGAAHYLMSLHCGLLLPGATRSNLSIP